MSITYNLLSLLESRLIFKNGARVELAIAREIKLLIPQVN